MRPREPYNTNVHHREIIMLIAQPHLNHLAFLEQVSHTASDDKLNSIERPLNHIVTFRNVYMGEIELVYLIQG